MLGQRRLPALATATLLLLALAASALAQGNENWAERFHPPGVTQDDYNGKVNVVVSRAGQIYIGGDFDHVGLVAANNIARWDGRRWHALDEGVNGEVTTLYVTVEALYVAGSFSEAGGEPAPYVARWTDGAWHRMGDEDFDGHVYCFETFGASVYAGGNFTQYGSQQMWHLARYVGGEWQQAETHGPVCYNCWPSQIKALKSYGGRLWVGGTFDMIDGSLIYNLATWHPDEGYRLAGSGGGVGPHAGYPVEVNCFDDQPGTLYFGGQFLEADFEDCLGLGYAVGTENLHGITPYGDADYWVRDLVDVGTTTLVVTDKWLRSRDGVGGWNPAVGSMVGAYCGHQAEGYIWAGGELIAENTHRDALARWDGGEWLRVGAGLAFRHDMGDRPATITSWDGDLFIGGTMTGRRSVSYDEPDCYGTVLYDGADTRPLAPGLDPVHCSLVYQGMLYVGGGFNPGGDGHLNRIARRVGDDWQPLGGGVSQGSISGEVNALTEWNGHLILGGYFNQADGLACDNLVAWDGTLFSLVDEVDFGSHVLSLCVFEGDLIVGGKFTSIDGATFGRVARWDGAAWSDMNGGFDDWVECLAVWEGQLYAGGRFTAADGTATSQVARWDGAAWRPLGTGMDGSLGVLALQASDVGLFAGGDFATAGGSPAAAVARWDGAAWAPLGDGLTGGPITPVLRDFAIHDGLLYMVGTFHYAGGKISANIARWDEAMTPVALLDFNLSSEPGAVDLDWEIASDAPAALRLVARLGGLSWEPGFEELLPGRYRCRDRSPLLAVGGEASYRLEGREDGEDWRLLRQAGIAVTPLPAAARPALAVWPNPANPRFNVELSLPAAAPVQVTIVDIAGRRVATLHEGPLAAGEHTLSWDGEGAASGVYLVKLSGPAGAVSERLVLLR